MARTKHPTPTDVLLPGDVPGHALTLAEETETKDIESEMAFKAAEAIGMIKALTFSATVADKAAVEVFIEMRKTKAYRAIQFVDESGNRRRIADLDEFCERYLKKSARRIREMAANYHLIGAELFEQAEQIGFRQQDYRTLKALPADDQDAIKAAMQTDDRDQILDLMQELAVRHASEKTALKAQTTEAEETAAARDDVIKAKEATISRLELRATSAERRQADFTDIEKRDYECAPLHDTINDAMVALAQMEVEVARLTSQVGGELVRTECEHALAMIAQRAIEISEIYRMPLDKDALLGDYAALELRAAGLTPEALQ